MANKGDSLFNSSSLVECGCNFENIDIHAQLGDIYWVFKYIFTLQLLTQVWNEALENYLNLLFPGRCSSNFRITILNLIIQLGHLLWNCLKINAIEPHLQEVTIGLGNGLVQLGNKVLPEPMLPRLHLHMTSLASNELIQIKTSTTHYQAILLWVKAGSCPAISFLLEELPWGDLGMKYPEVSKLISV